MNDNLQLLSRYLSMTSGTFTQIWRRHMISSPRERMSAIHRKSRRGQAALEMALLGPWFFFLSIGALDWGFYSYALITTESAARVAAEYTSTATATLSDSSGACTVALGSCGNCQTWATG